VLLAPLAECDKWNLFDERNGFALARTRDSRPLGCVERPPKAFGPAVVDDKDIFVDVAANTKVIDLTIDFTSVNHGQLCQRSPSDRDRFIAVSIVDEFMSI